MTTLTPQQRALHTVYDLIRRFHYEDQQKRVAATATEQAVRA